MPRHSDLIGKRFGKLIVLEYIGKNKHGNIIWKCKCDCGNVTTTTSNCLLTGNTKSCGCLAYDYYHYHTGKNIKHNKSNTRLYHIWRDMKLRCYNKSQLGYKNYGGRGIKVCEEWLNDFEVFYDWAINSGYQDNLTIDRINNNGNYEPNNCRWATSSCQSNNKTNSVFIDYNDKHLTVAQWSKITGLPYNIIWQRLKRGWDICDIFNKPIRRINK